jgi:hypothetical protein
MKNAPTPTVKVNHSNCDTQYTRLHFSIEKIKSKIAKGAKLSHYMGSSPFFVLKERDKKGRYRNWFLEPCEELSKLEHDFWK